MKIKHALVSATALGLLMGGAALADSNQTFITQNGDLNSALVNQSAGTGSTAGRAADPMLQQGDRNTLDILQVGANNRVGDVAAGVGLEQHGDRNQATINQLNNANSVNELVQTGPSGATHATNVLVVNQGVFGAATGSVVTSIRQTNDAGTDGTQNTVTINQGGTTGGNQNNAIGVRSTSNVNDWIFNGAGNSVRGGVRQDGNSNAATLSQNGTRNLLALVDQGGVGNTVTASQTGTRNMIGFPAPPPTGTSPIYGVVQDGNDNTANVTQNGNDNRLVELLQDGNGNTATVSLIGNENGAGPTAGSGPFASNPTVGAFSGAAAGLGIEQARVLQNGDGNLLGYFATGDSNLFGFVQIGDDNQISGTVAGSNNQLAVSQNGDGNIATVVQDDNGNNAGVAQTGDNNRVNARQQGGGNSLSALITGDNNGSGSFTNAGASALASANSLTSGDLFQGGLGSHTLNLTIISSSNQFAFLQTGGSLNSITATVTGAGGNQAVGVQDGSNNVATLTQAGASNVAVFQQVGGGNSTTISQ